MVLLSDQGTAVAMTVQVTFTSPHGVRDVRHNGNSDGFDSLRPEYAGGRPPRFQPHCTTSPSMAKTFPATANKPA